MSPNNYFGVKGPGFLNQVPTVRFWVRDVLCFVSRFLRLRLSGLKDCGCGFRLLGLSGLGFRVWGLVV